VASYRWWVNGTLLPKTTSSVDHTFAAAGTYDVTLEVTDNRGGVSAPFTKAVTTSVATNSLPTANFDYLLRGYSVNFTDKSTDADGVVTKWAWNFGDGRTSTLQSPENVVFGTSGAKSVTLTVTDERGASRSLTQLVTIGPVPITLDQPVFQNGNGSRRVDLAWSAASGPTVAIYRVSGTAPQPKPAAGTLPPGTPRVTTEDDGRHTDSVNRGFFQYIVCSTHDKLCSDWRGVNVQ
jgi:PKD repeat protein